MWEGLASSDLEGQEYLWEGLVYRGHLWEGLATQGRLVSQEYPESLKGNQPKVVADWRIPEILQAASEYTGDWKETPERLEANQLEVLAADWAIQERLAILQAASVEDLEIREEAPERREATQSEVLAADWALQEHPAILQTASVRLPENREETQENQDL